MGLIIGGVLLIAAIVVAVIFLTRDSGDGPAPEPGQVQVDRGNNPAADGNSDQGGNNGQDGNNAQGGGGGNVDPQAFWEKYLKDVDVTGDMAFDDPSCSRARRSAWRRKPRASSRRFSTLCKVATTATIPTALSMATLFGRTSKSSAIAIEDCGIFDNLFPEFDDDYFGGGKEPFGDTFTPITGTFEWDK